MFPAFAKIGRVSLLVWGSATALYGCPLYPDDCDGESDCASGFYCDRYSRRCEPAPRAAGCNAPAQCERGETCTPEFVCRPGSCDVHGCVPGYVCSVVDSAHTCVSGALPRDAGLDAAAPVDGGNDAAATDGGADASL